MKKKPTKMQPRIQLSRTVESAVIIMFVILQGNGNHFTASTGLLFFCLLSVFYVTSCLPGEGLSNMSARPTIGGNHHFHSYFKYTLNMFTCSFS